MSNSNGHIGNGRGTNGTSGPDGGDNNGRGAKNSHRPTDGAGPMGRARSSSALHTVAFDPAAAAAKEAADMTGVQADTGTAPRPDLARSLTAQGPATSGGLVGYLRDLRPSVVTGGQPFLPLGLFCALAFSDQMGATSQNILTPEIKDYFALSLTQVTTLSSVVGVLVILFSLPTGYLADRVSRTLLATIGAALLGVFGVMAGLAPTILLFSLARAGAGVGALAQGTQQSLLADYYPPQARAGVYAFRTLGMNVASLVTPAIAGVIAGVFVWQVVFIVVALSAAIPGIFVYFLPDPPRGYWERKAMGAEDEVARKEDSPPSFGESFRIVWSVRTMRRILYAIPFVFGSVSGLTQLFQLYLQQNFNVGVTERGFLQTLQEPFGIAGLLLGGVMANRLLRRRPGRVVTYTGLLSVLIGLFIGFEAVAPWLVMVIVFAALVTFVSAIIGPALTSLLSLVVPARVRTFGLSFFVVAAVPGSILVILAGYVGDRYSLRLSLLVLTGVFLLGAIIISTAGSGVDPDIRAANASAMAAEDSRRAREAGAAKMLVVRDLDVHYDQLQVLFNVDFDVEEGEIIALLGTNGAGKSTLLRAISGITSPSNGAVYYDGDDITHLPAHEHAGRGIIQVPGGRGVFPTLTVAENLRLAAWLHRGDEEYVARSTEAVLGYFPSLGQRLSTPASELSGGEQQMLTLGQAFLSRHRLLMIDELSLGLAPAVVAQLLDIVKAIADSGTTIVLVEQSVNVALTVARRAVYMEKGEIKFSGPTAELLATPDVLRSVYLKGTGGAGSAPANYGAGRYAVLTDGTTGNALEVKGVTKRFGGIVAIPGVDLTLEEGKIVGLVGPNGAGKTTLFDIISGFVTPDEGSVKLFGEDVTDLSPDQRAKLGLGRSFQDARLFPSLTVTENIALALETHLTSKSAVAAALHLPNVRKAEKSIEKRIDRLIRLMNLQDFRDKFVRELSTGSRRIVDLACVMACDPKVLLLDEPSSGIAQREAEELGPLLYRIKWETGCSMLLIEHDMSLIQSVSDELVALDLGTVVTRGKPEDVLEHPQVVASYLGTSEEVIHRSGDIG